MNADKLIEEYGYWNEHPQHPRHEWAYEVSEDYTRQGYWEWVDAREQED
jgi:hypothetical protein